LPEPLSCFWDPDCATRYLQDDDVVNRPIRVFQGGDDDSNPAAPCRAYVQRLQKAGKDERLTEYPGAHHVFDGVAFKVATKFPKVQTVRHCRIEEVSEGRLVNSETKQPFTYNDPCVERGVTMAYNAEAHAQAVQAVTELVNTVLRAR
jgi:dienelactone hydrolase